MRFLFVFAILCLPSAANAQLTVSAAPANAIICAEGTKQLGGLMLVPQDAELKLQSVLLVVVESKATNIKIEVEDQKRNRIEYEKVESDEPGKFIYAITQPGKFWIDVTAIDFAQNIYGSERIVSELNPAIGGLGSAIDIAEPSESLKRLIEPIRTKLASDPEKASLIANIFVGMATGMRGASGQRIRDVSHLNEVNRNVWSDLQTKAGVSIGAEFDSALQSHLRLSVESGGVENRTLSDGDLKQIANLYDAIAWAGVN